MYLPYIRAKQYDLAAIAEVDKRIYDTDTVVPIIEPAAKIVKSQYKRLNDLHVPFMLVINPIIGPLKSDEPQKDIVDDLINDVFSDYNNFWLAFIITAKTSLNDIKKFINRFPKHYHSFIHFSQHLYPESLIEVLEKDKNFQYNIFIDGNVSLSYINKFNTLEAYDILIKDGFKKQRKNELYPSMSHFSDLYKTYDTDLGFDGFGDFTIIGMNFEEGGGPAYVVVIHITDKDDDESLVVYHFKSDILIPPSPVDPGGKFIQALNRTIGHTKKKTHLRTRGTSAFQALHSASHFPGLGIAKKNSILHHIEFVFSLL